MNNVKATIQINLVFTGIVPSESRLKTFLFSMKLQAVAHSEDKILSFPKPHRESSLFGFIKLTVVSEKTLEDRNCSALLRNLREVLASFILE